MEPTPSVSLSTILDDLNTVADYLNVARRAEAWDDLNDPSETGTARLLGDCHQRLTALQTDLFLLRDSLEPTPTTPTPVLASSPKQNIPQLVPYLAIGLAFLLLGSLALILFHTP